MELFTLDSNLLVVLNKEWIQLHEPFKKIFMRDKGNNFPPYEGRHKKQAQAEFTYIYLVYDYRSNLSNYPLEERIVQAKKDSNLNPDWNPDQDLLIAIDRYKELQETRSLKLLNACYKTVDTLTTFFDTFTPTDVDEASKAIMAMSKVGETLEKLSKLERLVKKDLTESPNTRGNAELGFDELNTEDYK